MLQKLLRQRRAAQEGGRRALITFLLVVHVCRVLRRSQVSLVLRCQRDNLISEQRAEGIGTSTAEICVFGLCACWDHSQRGQTRSVLSALTSRLRSSCNQINSACGFSVSFTSHLFQPRPEKRGHRGGCSESEYGIFGIQRIDFVPKQQEVFLFP